MFKKSFILLGIFCIFQLSWALWTPPKTSKQREPATRIGGATEELRDYTRQNAWNRFQNQYGQNWSVDWNLKTGTPHRIFGGIIKSGSQTLIKSENDILVLAESFISANEDLLKISKRDLKLLQNQEKAGLWRVTYQQEYEGLIVHKSKIQLTYTNKGDLVQVTDDAYPGISIPYIPSITPEKAMDKALESFLSSSVVTPYKKGKLLVYPLETKSGYEYHLAYPLEVKTKNPVGRWVVFVDGQNGNILEKSNKIRFDAITGDAKILHKNLYQSDPNTDGNAAHLEIFTLNSTPLYDWNMDSNPGFTADASWQYGPPTGASNSYGYPDPSSSNSGSNNVYGYNLSGPYANNLTPPRYLKTPSLNFSGYSTLLLTFYRWLGVENSDYDHAKIETSPNGLTWSVLWANPDDTIIDDNAWTFQTYDISSGLSNQSTANIRWTMGTTDFTWNFSGWHLDDIKISQGLVGYADITGGLNITGFSIPSYQISAKSKGLYVETYNTIGGSTTYIQTVSSATSNQVKLNTSHNVIDELNVYYHVNRIHDFTKTIEPGYNGMDYPVPAYVLLQDPDIGGGYDNAYWDGYTVNFGQGSTFFNDLGLFADVIYHEYEHGITDYLYRPYEPSGAQHEGWSDYWACTITGEPDVGEGNAVIGEPYLRTLDNNLQSPDDETGEVHDDGRIIGAAMWKTRQAIGQYAADSIFHFARYGYSDNFNDYLQDVFLQDDAIYGDGNPANGSPHSVDIFEKFAEHGLAVLSKSYTIHEQLGILNNRPDPGETIEINLRYLNNAFGLSNVTCRVTSSDPKVTFLESTVSLGNFSILQNKTGMFVFNLATTAVAGDTIEFDLIYSSTNGYSLTQDFDLVVGYGPIYSFTLDYDPGFTKQGQWQYGMPTGGGGYEFFGFYFWPDPVGGYIGNNVYGYNIYGNYANNLASTNYLTSTPLDLTGLTDPELWFYRWLGVERSIYDDVNIQVSNNGSTWNTVWTNPSNADILDENWILQKYSLSPTADNQPTVYVRWGMGPTDNDIDLPGWNIDEIQIWALDPVTHVFIYVTGIDKKTWMLFD